MKNTAKIPASPGLLTPPYSPLVEAHSPFYFPRYASTVFQGLLRPHRPLLGDNSAVTTFRSRTRDSSMRRWQQFAGHGDADLPVPFTYLNSAGAYCLTRLLQALHINLSRVMHLKASIRLTQPLQAIRPDEIYTVHMCIKEIIPLKNRALLVTDSAIVDHEGQSIRHHVDHWHIRDTPTEAPGSMHPDTLQFRRLSQRTPGWQEWDDSTRLTARFYLPAGAARHYAAISGDYTPHATRLGARLFGQKRPFMQGFGLMNLALHHLTQMSAKPLQELAIVFARPALTGQDIAVHSNGASFEMCSRDNELLAFGQVAHVNSNSGSPQTQA